MVAKLVVHGKTRSEATVRMVRSLDEFVVEGVKTTIPLHRRIMQSERFRQGLLDTSFLEDVEVTDAG
jgi:acetyl-CoA carboxylase biotin carboxylase subunit